MVVKKYHVSFEVSGPMAMFARPDTGSSPVSYPIPTKSSLKSMAEALVFSREAFFEPLRLEVCSPIIFGKYSTNYCGPLKKSGTSNFQLFATVLEDVCFKVFGEISAFHSPIGGENAGHKMQEVFVRRLESGFFYTTPFLGWKEFVPSYFGPLRDSTSVEKSVNILIPSMLSEMYDRPTYGKVFPRYSQNISVKSGVVNYDK